jgi:hypothetical protein
MRDTAGFFASLANRVLLKTSMPTAGQIALWGSAAGTAQNWVPTRNVKMFWEKEDPPVELCSS